MREASELSTRPQATRPPDIFCEPPLDCARPARASEHPFAPPVGPGGGRRKLEGSKEPARRLWALAVASIPIEARRLSRHDLNGPLLEPNRIALTLLC